MTVNSVARAIASAPRRSARAAARFIRRRFPDELSLYLVTITGLLLLAVGGAVNGLVRDSPALFLAGVAAAITSAAAAVAIDREMEVRGSEAHRRGRGLPHSEEALMIIAMELRAIRLLIQREADGAGGASVDTSTAGGGSATPFPGDR